MHMKKQISTACNRKGCEIRILLTSNTICSSIFTTKSTKLVNIAQIIMYKNYSLLEFTTFILLFLYSFILSFSYSFIFIFHSFIPSFFYSFILLFFHSFIPWCKRHNFYSFLFIYFCCLSQRWKIFLLSFSKQSCDTKPKLQGIQ